MCRAAWEDQRWEAGLQVRLIQLLRLGSLKGQVSRRTNAILFGSWKVRYLIIQKHRKCSNGAFDKVKQQLCKTERTVLLGDLLFSLALLQWITTFFI